MSLEKELQTNEIVEHTIEINYRLPKFHHKILANMIDVIICVFLFFALFLASRTIVINTPKYQAADAKYQQSMLDSGLYFKSETNAKLLVDIVTHITNGSYSAKGKCQLSRKSLSQYLSYMESETDEEKYKLIVDDYRNFFLDPNLKPGISGELKDEPYFVEDLFGEVIPNPLLTDYPEIDNKYYKDCYEPYFDTHALKIYQTNSPTYRNNINYVNNMLLFVAVPSALLLAGFLTWFIPPLFFRKGRKTLGKALYHIGVVNKEYLNCSFPRFLARFAIFFFLEYILSIFTFCVPFIISITMSGFSKYKQSFPDYMLGLYEVDTSNNKIYNNKEEILLDETIVKKKPVDFRMGDIEQ